MLALRRVDSGLTDRLVRQTLLFRQALASGSVREVATQGGAMCRGYAAATAALEAAGAEDDAYQHGYCSNTGTRVVISDRKAVIERARERFGPEVIWATADEVAVLFGRIEALKPIAEVKRRFPGAEIEQQKPKIQGDENQ